MEQKPEKKLFTKKIFVAILVLVVIIAASIIGVINVTNVDTGQIITEVLQIISDLDGVNRFSEGNSLTLMIYMNGSDLESRYSLASDDISEMMSQLPRDDNLNVVLMTGGTKFWHTNVISNNKITYSSITKNGFEKLEELSNQSIGEYDTLANFIKYALNEFPAERYGLIFWNHGGGSVIGFGKDELYSNDSLDLLEIQKGLTQSLENNKLSFIGFDACLMASVEVAAACAPYAEYMIASEELEPGKGWAYDEILKTINDNTAISTLELCREIVNIFISSGHSEQSADILTLSVTDLSMVEAAARAIGKLGTTIANDIEFSYNEISKIRNDTPSFGRPTLTNWGTDMVDVIQIAENFSDLYPKECADVKEAVNAAVVYSRTSENVNGANGLSIYFPYLNKNIARSLDDYMNSPFDVNYLKMTRTFADKLLHGTYTPPPMPEAGEEIKLDSNLLYNIVEIYQLLVGKENGKLKMYGLDSDVDIDIDTGKINTKFSGEWVSINDIVVSIYSVTHTESIILYSSPALLNGEEVELMICYDDDNPTGAVYGARRVGDMPDKGYIKIADGDEIVFLYNTFKNDLQDRDYIEGEKITVAGELEVNVISVPEGEYLYGFCLIDIYQNKHYTSLLEENR